MELDERQAELAKAITLTSKWQFSFEFLSPVYTLGAGPHKVRVYCINHGEIEVNYKSFIANPVCEECMETKTTDKAKKQRAKQKEFVEKHKTEASLLRRFVQNAQGLYGDRYTYNNVVYIDCKTPVNITCKKHGDFPVVPESFLRRVSEHCPQCRQPNKKLTEEEYINQLREVYGDDYDYSETHYVNSKTSVVCRCKKHDRTFRRSVLNLKKGFGCPDCLKEKGLTYQSIIADNYDPEKRKEKWTKEKFIEEAIKKHGKRFDYSLVEYVNNDTPVTIRCTKCNNTFTVTPDSHLRSRAGGCSTCQSYYRGKTVEQKFADYVRKAHAVYGDKYIYKLDDFKTEQSSIIIYCPTHKDYFSVSKSNHLKGEGCPLCDGRISGETSGEHDIRKFLDQHNVNYKCRKRMKKLDDKFDGISYIIPDFYLPDHNIIIEFNGLHHYESVEYSKDIPTDIWRQRYRDQCLRSYCQEHNITMIEIPYTEQSKIPTILSQYIK